jgi:hypothetical protein
MSSLEDMVFKVVNNDIPHINQQIIEVNYRLTSIETSQKWLQGITLLTLTTVIGGAVAIILTG